MVIDELSFITAVIAGLLSGVHCFGMCGGIVTALTLGTPATTLRSKILIQLSYNLGRISSYCVLGLLAGALGQASTVLVKVHAMQVALEIVAGLFMLAMGLYLANWWRGLSWIEQHVGQTLWRRIQPLTRRMIPVRTSLHAFLVGSAWGWIPCGLVYSMAIFALSSGSVWQGGWLMLGFGLGTLPNLLAAGMMVSTLQRFIRHPITRVIAGGTVILFALIILARAVLI